MFLLYWRYYICFDISDFGNLHGCGSIDWKISGCLSSLDAKASLLQIHNYCGYFVDNNWISPIFRDETHQWQFSILDHRFDGKSWLCSVQQLLEWHYCDWTITPCSTVLLESQSFYQNQSKLPNSLWIHCKCFVCCFYSHMSANQIHKQH